MSLQIGISFETLACPPLNNIVLLPTLTQVKTARAWSDYSHTTIPTRRNYYPLKIRDVTLKTCQKRWMIGRSGERGSGIFVLAARHDDDDYYPRAMSYPGHLLGRSLTLLQRSSLCILQPQPTRPPRYSLRWGLTPLQKFSRCNLQPLMAERFNRVKVTSKKLWCVKCWANHAADCRACNVWEKQKEVSKVKCTKCVSFPEACKIVETNFPNRSNAKVVKVVRSTQS